MPYEPYDTGWIKPIYGLICLTWLIYNQGCLPTVVSAMCFNNIFIPMFGIAYKLLQAIANSILTVGTAIIQIESCVFRHFNYIDPIFNCIQRFERLMSSVRIHTNPSMAIRPSGICRRHNSSNNKSSSGRHSGMYHARKRLATKRSIITQPWADYWPTQTQVRSNPRTQTWYQRRPIRYKTRNALPAPTIPQSFYPIDDPSYLDVTWYDAISPYWTGGMIWNSAYVLNHQVVSVTTDPIFVSNLSPTLEMSGTVQPPEARSGGKNVGPRTTIALDSGSSIHIFKDAFLLADILSDDSKSIAVRTTDSKFQVNDIGRLCDDLNTLPLPRDGYYYYPNGVANLLSLAMLTETKRVVMDSAIDNAIYVFNNDGSYIRFAKTSVGMYCIDIGTDSNDHVVMAHQTVKGESAQFSAIDCRRAAKVRELQQVLACPSDIDLANAVEHNIIGYNRFTRRDIRIAKKIYGPDVPSLKGKTVKRPSKMPENDTSELPSFILKEYTDVHISIDLMHVNGVKFLIAHSKHIGLLQTYCVRKNNREAILACILKIVQSYKSRSVFKVVTIEADGAFKSIKHELEGDPYNITLSTCDADRHVETIERQIRFLKERIRAVRLMMPYKKLPMRFTIEMVHQVAQLINSLPKSNGIHAILSPREIVSGKKFRCPTIKIGQYVQGLTGGTNSTDQERSIDALYIGRADNGSGHSVFKLSTKQVVSVNRVVIIPTSEATITAVNHIGNEEGQPEGLEFSDMNGKITLDDFAANDNNDDDSNASDADFKMDEEYQDELDKERKLELKDNPDNDADPDSTGFGSDDPDSQIDFFQNPIQQHNQGVEPVIFDNRTRSANNPTVTLTTTTPAAKQECGSDKKKKYPIINDGTHLIEEDLDDDLIQDNTVVPNNDKVIDAAVEEPSVPSELVSDLGSYWAFAQSSHAYVLNTIASYNNIEASKSTPQYGFNRGLKEFKDLGYEATVKELDDNLLGMNAVKMLNPSEVNQHIRYEALNYLMFLKRKRCGKIKARGCADGRPQREYITKEESSSPTVSIYALMTSCLMDAIEGRYVATCDIPGAFLQADWPADHDCWLKFDGVMVGMICKINPEYKKNLVPGKNGKKHLYAKLTKAVYGTLLGAKLFYDKLSKQLVEWGYEPNCYDGCTFNKMVDGNQVTIQFHVDDLKISHVKQSVVDAVLTDLNKQFGTTRKPLAASTGLVHDYLGITIDYSEKGKVIFTMYDYLEDILEEMPNDMRGTSPTPASSNLFDADEDSPLLNEKEADFFHRTTARLLFASKRARPDLQVAVAYLCTRVKAPTQSDYRKLTRVIKYLRLTISIPLVLGWDGTGKLLWSVDASFAIHKDMRSHTGAVLTLGQGALLAMSIKQKINTKSSTEAELVGVDDAMNFVEWVQLFVGEQLKSINNDSILKKIGSEIVIQQDNTSTILLARNGKQSSTKRTRHINIRYFYVTSKIKDGSMSVIYHPTKEMVSDYLTKPLQGCLFRTHRNSIMGHTEESIAKYHKAYSDAKKGGSPPN